MQKCEKCEKYRPNMRLARRLTVTDLSQDNGPQAALDGSKAPQGPSRGKAANGPQSALRAALRPLQESTAKCGAVALGF